MSNTSGEILESRALLADIERQIALQERLIGMCRSGGRPTQPVIRKLLALTQMAERKRDYIRFMTRTSEPRPTDIPACSAHAEPSAAPPVVRSPGASRLNPGRWIWLRAKKWTRSAC